MKIVKAETPAVDTENSAAANSINPASEVAATSASHVRPVVRITDSYDIIISGLPVISQEELDQSCFHRICHALKHRYMNDSYTKHDDFLRSLNGNKLVKRPRHFPPICVCYMLTFTYIDDERRPDLVIKFIPSVSFPSAHIRCAANDPLHDYRTGSLEEPIYWRPLPKDVTDKIVKQFSKICAKLIEAHINLIWGNTPDNKTPIFY